MTGKYRGAAHSRCNLQLRKQYQLSVFLHNFSGYDCHLIMKVLKHFPRMELKIIGQGMEKYLCLRFGQHIIFKDSLMFMGSSLEKLANNLRDAGTDRFKQLFAAFPRNTPEDIELLLRKGVYPYDYMDKWAKFEEAQLPPREAFFSRLRNEECSEADYAHAQLVWTTFGLQKMREYHDLYLKSMSQFKPLNFFKIFQITPCFYLFKN